MPPRADLGHLAAPKVHEHSSASLLFAGRCVSAVSLRPVGAWGGWLSRRGAERSRASQSRAVDSLLPSHFALVAVFVLAASVPAAGLCTRRGWVTATGCWGLVTLGFFCRLVLLKPF